MFIYNTNPSQIYIFNNAHTYESKTNPPHNHQNKLMKKAKIIRPCLVPHNFLCNSYG